MNGLTKTPYEELKEENEKLKAQLEVAMEALKVIGICDIPEHLIEVRTGYLMNRAREAIKKIEDLEK